MRWGTGYYPELVPAAEWEGDLGRMREAGIDHLRIGDFAWSALEPREGAYAWEWLDAFIALAAAHGLGLILCTPTATPPAWLARQFPEIMLGDRRQEPRPWGNRRDVDVENPIYQDYAVRLAGDLAARYGGHPAVFGWQIDNELVGSELLYPENHSRAAQWRFRRYLKRVHGATATLNERWGMRFWNQEISDWGEIDTPHHERPCLGHWLDYCRHFSEAQRDFLALQAAAIRPHLRPGAWISHNSTAVFDRGLDHRVYAEALDIVGWDAYGGAACGRVGRHPADFTALAHDYFRSTRPRPFWVFETGPFAHGHTPALMAEMAVRGAGGICFWHWRAHRAHVEMSPEGFCDYAGRPIGDRVAQLRRLVDDARLAALPAPVPKRAAVALLFAPDGVRSDMHPNPYRATVTDWYLRAVVACARALRRHGVPIDVVRPGDALDAYRLVVAPSPIVLADEDGARLARHVADGAVFLGCAKTAHLDPWGAYRRDLGAPLAGVLGGTLTHDGGTPADLAVRWGDETCPAEAWAERMDAVDGEVLARVAGGAWDGAVAAYRRTSGRGTAYYLPCWSDRLCELVVPLALASAGLPVPAAVPGEIGAAADPLGRGTWIFNPGATPQAVGERTLAAGAYELLPA